MYKKNSLSFDINTITLLVDNWFNRSKTNHKIITKKMMLISLLILVLSILFISGFLSFNVLNSTKKFLLLHIKKPLFLNPNCSLGINNNPIIERMNKNDYDYDYDLKRVFGTFDKNGDGFITKEELMESLNNMGMMVLGKDIEEMVERLDTNKDGWVDVGEFRELYELVKGKKHDKGKKLNDDDDDVDDDVDEDLKEAFNVFDENKDGVISVEELGLVLSSLGLKQGNREEDCKEMIKKVDVDGDGMVNFDEFKMMMRSTFSSSSSKLVHAS